MEKIIIKVVDDFTNLPIKERPFSIPTIHNEVCGEFVLNEKRYKVFRNKHTCVYEYIHETEKLRENKGYNIMNPNKCFTFNDIVEYFKSRVNE